MQLLVLNSLPIFEQLQLEEALLRTSSENYCILNAGSPPAIVLGISQDRSLVIDEKKYTENQIPLIRRYSGGGTVVVDSSTVFLTLILNHDKLPVTPFPKEVLGWIERVITPAFANLPFSLRENDFVLGEKKIRGNAQYFSKNRIVHHTTFLWDYDEELMSLLSLPPKMPSYRNERSHKEFITTLKPHFSSKAKFIDALRSAIDAKYPLIETNFESVSNSLAMIHRKSSTKINNIILG